METIIIHPRDKEELDMLKLMLKKMAVKAKVLRESGENEKLKTAMLLHSKNFFISKMD
jgi:hypothetical protein